jgi:hypothetical protein
MTPQNTRKNSAILFLIALILLPIISWLGNAMRPVVVNGVNNGGVVFYSYGWYVLMIVFLFLMPFSIVSFIFPKLKLLTRAIIGLVLIWPLWILMWVVPSPNFGNEPKIENTIINVKNNQANPESGTVAVPQGIK